MPVAFLSITMKCLRYYLPLVDTDSPSAGSRSYLFRTQEIIVVTSRIITLYPKNHLPIHFSHQLFNLRLVLMPLLRIIGRALLR